MGKAYFFDRRIALYFTLLIGLVALNPAVSFAVDSVCARVKIEIQQELTLERQAFDAHLRVNNGLSHITLEDVRVDVIFTDADYKFYLTAKSEVRAQRLMLDENRGISGESLEKVKEEVEQRDERDMEREVAPLKIPEGAIVIDNSGMTLEQTVAKFLSFIA